MSGTRKGVLSPKDRKFVEEYFKDYNKTAAYKRFVNKPDMTDDAAYNAAYKILRKDACIEYLHQLQEEALKQSGLNATKILNMLEDIANDPTSTKTERMKAADLMSKNLGLQTQKVESTAKVVVINIDDEDDDNTD